MRPQKPQPYKVTEAFKLADWNECPEEELSIDDITHQKFTDKVKDINNLRNMAGGQYNHLF